MVSSRTPSATIAGRTPSSIGAGTCSSCKAPRGTMDTGSPGARRRACGTPCTEVRMRPASRARRRMMVAILSGAPFQNAGTAERKRRPREAVHKRGRRVFLDLSQHARDHPRHGFAVAFVVKELGAFPRHFQVTPQTTPHPNTVRIRSQAGIGVAQRLREKFHFLVGPPLHVGARRNERALQKRAALHLRNHGFHGIHTFFFSSIRRFKSCMIDSFITISET